MPKTNSSPIDDLEIKTNENNKDSKEDDQPAVTLSAPKAALMKKLLMNIRENNEQLISLISSHISDEQLERIAVSQIVPGGEPGEPGEDGQEYGGRVVEGVFDGENMIGPDGKQYSVPANYASKSKLVEGDILKLTITANGTFVYKQIGPIERNRLVGILEKTGSGNFQVNVDGQNWRILTASVTYFKGELGDEVIILVPKTGESKWAAVENIVKKPS